MDKVRIVLGIHRGMTRLPIILVIIFLLLIGIYVGIIKFCLMIGAIVALLGFVIYVTIGEDMYRGDSKWWQTILFAPSYFFVPIVLSSISVGIGWQLLHYWGIFIAMIIQYTLVGLWQLELWAKAYLIKHSERPIHGNIS